MGHKKNIHGGNSVEDHILFKTDSRSTELTIQTLNSSTREVVWRLEDSLGVLVNEGVQPINSGDNIIIDCSEETLVGDLSFVVQSDNLGSGIKSVNLSDINLTYLNVEKLVLTESLYANEGDFDFLNLSFCKKLTTVRVTDCNIDAIEWGDAGENITNIHLYGNNLTEAPLSNFPNITYFYASSNKLVSLDCSQNPLLETLTIASNTTLTSLNISGCSGLVTLIAARCSFSSVDLLTSPLLRIVDFGFGDLTSLDCTGLLFLEEITTQYNPYLTSVITTGCTSLVNFSTRISANVTSLDVTTNINLEVLGCAACNLTSVDLSQNPKLRIFNAYSNFNMAVVNFDNNPDMEKIFLGGNNTTSDFSTSHMPNLTILDVGSNTISAFDISLNAKLVELLIDKSYNITTLDVSTNIKLKEIDVAGSANLSFFSTLNNPLLTFLNISSTLYGSTLDLTHLVNLKTLRSNSNGVTSLDISACPALEELQVSDNSGLITFDTSNNLNLSTLQAEDIGATSFNTSHLVKLDELRLSSNELTTIDLSTNVLLSLFNIYSNDLVSLDLSNNPKLVNAAISNMNALTELNLKNGNNIIVNNISLTNCPLLTCVLVDDAAYSTANWLSKDAQTIYSDTTCPI